MLRSLLKNIFRQRRDAEAGRDAITEDTQSAALQIPDLLRAADACRLAGQNVRARQCYTRVIAFEANHPDARYALGVLEGQAGNYVAATEHLNELLSAHPEHVHAWNALGNVNKLQRKWEGAIACYRRAVELDPRLASALSNLGTCLRNQGREIEGMDCLARAVVLEPSNVEILFNSYLGMMEVGRVEEGEQGLLRILEQQPQNAEARLVRGCQLLAAGRFSEGWREYEWRSRVESWERRNAEYSYPWWNGEDPAGRRLLVRGEQGLGDQIMFASCLPELLQGDGRIILECDARLESIFARSFPGAAVYSQSRQGKAGWASDGLDAELQVNIGSLPLLLQRGSGTFPSHAGYLRPDPSKVESWRKRLAGLDSAMKIGVSWRGGTLNTRQATRSLELRDLAPVLRHGPASFVSVQYGDCAAEIQEFERESGITLHHWQAAIDDYDETAALVAALDLLISVQTAVVHLGGALSKPVWVMVPARPEWRYMRSGERMPWYPSVRLFRQDIPGEWDPVIDRIAAELTSLLLPARPPDRR
jgi:tetratricopeptide (TPR) repeat protein